MTDKCSKIREIPTPVCALARNDTVFRHAESRHLFQDACFLDLYSNSRIPVPMSSNPKSFFKESSGSIPEVMDPEIAPMQPKAAAGRICLIQSVPCFHRKQQETTAEGRKNSRLINRAVAWSVPMTKVSHRSSRLPPPAPSPDRNPKTVATAITIRMLPAINSGCLPTVQEFPAAGGAKEQVFSFPIFRRLFRPENCQASREQSHARTRAAEDWRTIWKQGRLAE